MIDMDTNGNNEQANRIIAKFENMVLPIGFREFSKDEYMKLFPEGTVKTPLGIVKLGFHQYEKLVVNDRKGLVASMFWTLKDPIVILSEIRDSKESRIYIKSFRKLGSTKIIIIISVVADIDGQAIAISTGKRKIKQIIQKIKLARSIIYEKVGGS